SQTLIASRRSPRSAANSERCPPDATVSTRRSTMHARRSTSPNRPSSKWRSCRPRRLRRAMSESTALLTVDQVAERLALDRSTVYVLAQRGELAHIRVTLTKGPSGRSKGALRFTAADVDDWIR